MTIRNGASAFADLPAAAAVATAIARLAAGVRQHAWQEASAAGLTPTQGNLLDLLTRRRQATLAELAEALGIRPATASEAVSTLVEKGLVHKGRQAADARRLALRLTPEGKRAARSPGEWPDFLAAAAARLEPASQHHLLALLVRLIRELQRHGEIPVARMCVSCRHFRPRVHPDPLRPHHCAFVDAPFGDGAFRLDCPDHESAEPSVEASALEVFARTN